MSWTLTDMAQRKSAAGTPASADGSASAPPAVTLLLVDDDRVASYSLWALLNWRPGIRVRGTAESSTEARRMVRRLRPDVCLVSAALGCRRDAGRLIGELRQVPEPPRILIYSDHRGPGLSAMAALCGADGAVSRYGDPAELADLIRRTAAGGPGRAPHPGRGVPGP